MDSSHVCGWKASIFLIAAMIFLLATWQSCSAARVLNQNTPHTLEDHHVAVAPGRLLHQCFSNQDCDWGCTCLNGRCFEYVCPEFGLRRPPCSVEPC
ncbi:hypothetical protein CBR_g50273 [Chara braunii]|uniref:Uncharacterized protein n=1 Tax=Chara braunii TaxID=69332 RepID=A0A388M6R3_CHABU|nr:hypothetical protein CBR_g50273 [Chara braunii]|eukprot:GBG90179.1 hypothetical protein CBR_g50273 [Chara braunii]